MAGRIVLLIGILVWLSQCDSTHDNSLSGWKGPVADSVTAMLHQYQNDVRKHGLMAEFGYLDSSSDFFWLPPGFNKKLNFNEVRAIIKKSSAALRLVDNHFESLEVTPLSPTQAVYKGKLRSAVTDTGNKSTVMWLEESGFVLRRHGGWTLLFGRTNMAGPPAEINNH